MRPLILIASGLIVCTALMSCAVEDNLALPVISIEDTDVITCADGGRFIVSYSVQNGRKEDKLSVTSEQEWITGLEIISCNEFSFDVQPNNGYFERSGEIKVEYPGVNDKCIVNILQHTLYGDEFFHIDVTDSSETSVTYCVKCKDQEMPYLSIFWTNEEYYNLSNDQERFVYEMNRLDEIAQINGITLEEYLRRNIRRGDSDNIIVKNLDAGEKYCISVFGVNEAVELLTPFVVKEYTAPLKKSLDVDYKIDYDIDGNFVLMMVEPSSEKYPYVCDAYAKDAIDRDDIVSSYQKYIDDYVALFEMFGKTASDAVKEIGHIGKDAIEAKLEGYTDYYGFAIAIDMEGQLISDAFIKEFTTGHPKPSDNIIDIEIQSIKASSVNFLTTTTNEDQYAITVKESKELDGMSDDQIIEYLSSGSSKTLMKGSKEGTISNLKPSTGYSFFAFGYSGGVSTTGLFREDFTTADETSEQASFELVFDKYFDGTALSEIYSGFDKAKGKAVLPVEVLVNEYADGFLYNVYAGNWTDKSNPTDADAIDNLLVNGISKSEMTYFIDYDIEHTVIGFAYDSEGYAGEVFRKLILLTEDGVSPVEEYEKTSPLAVMGTTNLAL